MSVLFFRFSNVYFWYFSTLGLVVPFLTVYLDSKGFNSLEIGQMLAMFTATKIIGPTFWANFADKTGKQLLVIRLGALLALCCFALLFFLDNYWPLSIAMVLFGLFWTAILPQLEAMTLGAVKQNAKIYARIRLWGSVGFMVLAFLAGEIIELFSAQAFIWLGLMVLAALLIASLQLKQGRIRRHQHIVYNSILSKIFQARFICFFIAGLLLQISFGPFYSFFALYIKDLAYPSYAVGLFLAVGIIAEIILFLLLGRLFKRFTVKQLLVFSLLISAIRWYLNGALGFLFIGLFVAQLFHAFSFGLFHSASMQFIQQHFTAKQQNRGQAIYVSGVYGVGGALGAYIAGVFWQDGSGAQTTYYIAAAIALVAAVIAYGIPATQKSLKHS